MITPKTKGPSLPKQLINGISVSGQEHQVFRLVGKGFRGIEIASQLKIGERNISKIKRRLKQKLGLLTGAELASYSTREQVKEEIKDGDFVHDDLLAWWLSLKLKNVKAADLLDWILEFRLLTPAEAWEQLKEKYPAIPIRRPS